MRKNLSGAWMRIIVSNGRDEIGGWIRATLYSKTTREATGSLVES